MKGRDMMERTYYSLHNHTASSNARLIDSINKVEDLQADVIKLQKELGVFVYHPTTNRFCAVVKSFD